MRALRHHARAGLAKRIAPDLGAPIPCSSVPRLSVRYSPQQGNTLQPTSTHTNMAHEAFEAWVCHSQCWYGPRQI